MFWVFLVLSLGAAEAFKCDFEKSGLCGLTNSANNRFKWVRKSDNTGHCASVYAPYPRPSGGTARLAIKLDLFPKTCISFKYRVSGKRFAKLFLDVDGFRVFEKRSSRKDNKWKASGELYLEGFQGKQIQVKFQTKIGKRFDGVIEIDNVNIYDCGNPIPGPTTQPPTPPPPVTTQGPSPPVPTTQSPPPPPPGSCGVGPSTRIVGGTTASPNSWPWQAQLRTSGYAFCGGSLIDKQWVLTAAHCVESSSPKSIIVRLGAHHIDNKGDAEDLYVLKIVKHPSYNSPKQYAHDIALLKLDKEATLNDKVNLVCLPDTAIDAPVDGTHCWITGWGRLSSGGATPDYLQQVSVPIASRDRCDKAYPNMIHDSMICAGQDQGGIDSCQGDSGGPMVYKTGDRYYLHGVTSWGYGCADPGKFGVYAKVKYLRKWVVEEMAKN